MEANDGTPKQDDSAKQETGKTSDATSKETLEDLEDVRVSDANSESSTDEAPAPDGAPDPDGSGRADGSDSGGPM